MFSYPANATKVADLDIGVIAGPQWKIEGVNVSLGDFSNQPFSFSLSAKKLTLPEPFSEFSLADIHCENLTWSADVIDCKQGMASVKTIRGQLASARFRFHREAKKSVFSLMDADFTGATFSLNAKMTGSDWQIKFSARNVGKTVLGNLVSVKRLKILEQFNQGKVNVSGLITGRKAALNSIALSGLLSNVGGQTQDGKLAAENLGLQARFHAQNKGKIWQWQSEVNVLNGSAYADPIFFEVKSLPIQFTASGMSDLKTTSTTLTAFTFEHPGAVTVTGTASGFYKNKIQLEQADVSVHSDSPQGLFNTYISPYLTGSPLAEAKITGKLDANFKLIQQAVTQASLNFSQLNFASHDKKLSVTDGAGTINWSNNPLETRHSQLSWQAFWVKGLPIKAATLSFVSQANAFNLAEKVRLPLLNGILTIDKFSWQAKPGDEPDVSFAGRLDNLSLEQLTKTLGWKPMSGNISGQIPGVDYHNKVLSLGGELLINVFNGSVKISKLKSSGLFSGFPRLESEIKLDNLDLEQLTRKFEFGAITGRLSGFVNNLILENWHPVSFYAWFGTPDDDGSSHRISQKAVKNIASIGGGGASDLLSRGFLSFFETFRYDKIGMGCYLHNGACQLMGLEASGQGYYLIKGGWLPRIDVLGYNPRVNWDVLVERLKRVTTPEQAVIQ